MSDAPQGIYAVSSQQCAGLSRSSSLEDFEIVDVEPAPEGAKCAGLQSEVSDPTADSESETESEFEVVLPKDREVVLPKAELARESPPAEAEAEHPQKWSAPDEVESLHPEDDVQMDDIESVASADILEASPSLELEVVDESFHPVGDTHLDESDKMCTGDAVVPADIPEATLTAETEFRCEESATPDEIQDGSPAGKAELQLEPEEVDSCDWASVQLEEPEASPTVAADVRSSTRTSCRRGLAPAEVSRVADKVAKNASDGLSEAVRLINCLDSRLKNARPHVVDGVTYFTQQVQDDFQSTAKDMRDAFGEGQESEPTAAATFSHFKSQFKNDFNNIRKDVDSAFGCVLGSTDRHDEAAAFNECAWPSEQDDQQQTLKTAIPAAACSAVSMAVASWLVPIRLARLTVANLAM